MTISRRSLISGGLVAGASLLVKQNANAQPAAPTAPPAPKQAANHDSRIVVPNGSVAEWKLVGGVKVFHLRAEPIEHEIAPGLTIHAWGYNGHTPGPVLEGVVGDRVRVYVTNKLPEVTSVHWHGLFVKNGMDGVAGLTQPPIKPGKTFRYDFVLDRVGTFMYHPHADEMTQIALGMFGMIVVHPRAPERRRVRDYCLMSHEWKIPIGTRRPDPMAMNDFNTLAFNGKAYPATDSLIAETGDLVRIRFANLGPMDHHPIHIHGHAMTVVGTDGGEVPPSARFPETTVLVPVGTTRTVEFVADNPGDWPLHCHMTHHAMNQMGHAVSNMIGVDTKGLDAQVTRHAPGYMSMGTDGMHEMSAMRMKQPENSISMVPGKGPHGIIEMGSMFTLLKVRKHLDGVGDPGWYAAPSETVATEATADELARDGITP